MRRRRSSRARPTSRRFADRDLAQLNLERSQVQAPVDGMVTNLSMRPGDYVTAGRRSSR